MTSPETLLWERLRRRATGARFRRQHPIGPYVVDFYRRAAALVVEVDDECHNRETRPQRDEARSRFFAKNGCRVLHVAAARILRDPDATADAIGRLAAAPLHLSAAPNGPPPRAGEEQG